MGPVFAIVFWLIVGGVLLLLFFGLLLATVWFKRRKKTGLALLFALPLAVLLIGTVSLLGVVAHRFIQTSRPAFVFERAFQVPPSTNATNIRSKYSIFGDSEAVHLRFNCSEEWLATVLTNGFKTITFEDFQHETRDAPRTVSWWTPPVRREIVRYYRRIRPDGGRYFNFESEVIAYEPIRNEVFYRYSGLN